MDISAHPIRCRLRTMERQETRHVMCEQSLAAPQKKEVQSELRNLCSLPGASRSIHRLYAVVHYSGCMNSAQFLTPQCCNSDTRLQPLYIHYSDALNIRPQKIFSRKCMAFQTKMHGFSAENGIFGPSGFDPKVAENNHQIVNAMNHAFKCTE